MNRATQPVYGPLAHRSLSQVIETHPFYFRRNQVLQTGTATPIRSHTTPRVIHVIYSMKQGGAETLLLEAALSHEPGGGRISAYPPLVVCWNHEGALGQRLRDAGIPVVVLNQKLRPMWKVPLFLADLGSLVRQVRKIARDHNAPIIHGHLIDSAFLALLAVKGTGAKSVATIYSNHVIPMSIKPGTMRHMIWNALAKWSLNRVDRVITISPEVTHTLTSRFGTSADHIHEMPVTVKPIHVDIPMAEARKELGIGPDDLCLVFVGRLVSNKNQADLIRLTRILADRGLSVRLLLVGDGPDRGALARLSDELGVASRVQLLGLYGDLPGVFAAADMFVTASRSEGVSLAILEAMSAGLPVVSTPSEGNCELLGNGLGTLAASARVEHLADAVMNLWNDEGARRTQAQRAKDNYERRFTPKEGAGLLEEPYDEVVKGRKGS